MGCYRKSQLASVWHGPIASSGNTKIQVPLQTFWIRICIWTISPGRSVSTLQLRSTNLQAWVAEEEFVSYEWASDGQLCPAHNWFVGTGCRIPSALSKGIWLFFRQLIPSKAWWENKAGEHWVLAHPSMWICFLELILTCEFFFSLLTG